MPAWPRPPLRNHPRNKVRLLVPLRSLAHHEARGSWHTDLPDFLESGCSQPVYVLIHSIGASRGVLVSEHVQGKNYQRVPQLARLLEFALRGEPHLLPWERPSGFHRAGPLGADDSDRSRLESDLRPAAMAIYKSVQKNIVQKCFAPRNAESWLLNQANLATNPK